MAKTKTSGSRLRLETKLVRDTLLHNSRGGTRLFRNTVGAGFVGPHVFPGDGSVIISRPSRITYGLGEGTPDIVGWQSKIITPADVGYRIAQFVAIECKRPDGKPTSDQKRFLRIAWDCGALAGVARSDEDVAMILEGRAFNVD